MYGKNVKLWGQTQSVLVTDKVHVATAFIKKGGYSSKHLHKNNWNRFVVQSGVLQIDIYRNNKTETIELRAGDVLDVEPNLKHRMTALEDVHLTEIYWSATDEFDVEDIQRDDTGGVRGCILDDNKFVDEYFAKYNLNCFRQELPS